MFSSKPRDESSVLTPLAPASTPAPALQPRNKPVRSSAPSILSADATITGTLVSAGDMQIDGKVEGDVRSVNLVIGDKAEIHGEIVADDVTVRGRVIGRIRARKVLLCATSHVEGDILHEAFAVESGAFFEGNCRHSDDPLGEAAPAQQTVVSVAPRAAKPGPAAFAPVAG
jgi:cytoskeletal protein CcmA (bactofilin family)